MAMVLLIRFEGDGMATGYERGQGAERMLGPAARMSSARVLSDAIAIATANEHCRRKPAPYSACKNSSGTAENHH
jgi:hypothetical protein